MNKNEQKKRALEVVNALKAFLSPDYKIGLQHVTNEEGQVGISLSNNEAFQNLKKALAHFDGDEHAFDDNPDSPPETE